MMKRRRGRPRIRPLEPAELDAANDQEGEEEEDEIEEKEEVTVYPVPEIFLDEENENKNALIEPIVIIEIYRRQDPSGRYSYIGHVKPEDIPTQEALLHAKGPGAYKLRGKGASGKCLRTRHGVDIGEWSAPAGSPPPNQPAWQAHTHAPPPPPPRAPQPPALPSGGGGGIALLTTLLPIVAGMIQSWITASSERHDKFLQMMMAQHEKTEQAIATFARARTEDLEQLLRQSFAAKGGAGGGMTSDNYVQLLADQQAMFEELMKEVVSTIRAGNSGGDEIEKLVGGMLAGVAHQNGWIPPPANAAADPTS